MNNKFLNINPKGDYRLVVISDIHGHQAIFERLLERLALRDEDYLVILGDFINRGIDSYATCRAIQKLSARKNTIVLKGNHEYFIHANLESETTFKRFLPYLKAQYFETLIGSMLKSAGKTYDDFQSPQALYRFILAFDPACIAFIKNLPILIKFDEFILVHGGYDVHFDPIRDEGKFLKFDEYNVLSGVNEERVIVGHWPTGNLRSEYLSNVPYFNAHKNIVFVDGGLGVKTTGELNAMVVDKCNGAYRYDFLQENDFKPASIIREHVFRPEPDVFINYPNFEVEVLASSGDFVRCRHVESQRTFTTFSEMLIEKGDKTQVRDEYTNRFLNLSAGDPVSICAYYGNYILVKYGEQFGWVLKDQIST